MITVRYELGYIDLIPDTSDENTQLIDIFKTSSKVIYTNGMWRIPETEIDWINVQLIPVKKYLFIDDTFKAWKQSSKGNTYSAVIRVGVINSFIRKGSQEIPHKAIEEVTRYFWKAAPNHPKYKAGKWDGYINLYKRWEKCFPSGLLKDVMVTLTQKGIEFKVEYIYDTNPPKEFNWTICDNIIPDPDQIEAVEKAVEGKRGVVKAPTGFGKTAVLAKRLVAHHGVPALFIANKKSLLDDAKNEFMSGINHLSDCSTIKDGWFGNVKLPSDNIAPLTAPVVVATIQSLHARLKDERTRPFLEDWLKNTCKFIMVDECQATGTKIWDEVLEKCNAPYRIFLSATPRRTDGATIKLMAGSGPILFTTTAEEQIQKGRLCELDINYISYDHKLYNDYDTDVNYNEMYRACIIENEERNQDFIVKPTIEMTEEGRSVLVLIQYIEHGHILKRMFIEHGIKAEDIRFIWGETPDKMRTNAIQEFKKGSFKIMIGSTIFDAGVNIPVISGVVLGGAGNSDITLIQRIGRGARNCDYGDLLGYLPEFLQKSHGQKITKVYDILDANAKFFHKQALNRYYNARDEFGADRVHLIGDKSMLRRPKKSSTKVSKDVDPMTAQLEMLKEFSN